MREALCVFAGAWLVSSSALAADAEAGRGKAEVCAACHGPNGNAYWGRPVDVQVMNDGALLVSDDVAGALFRISYKK